MVYSYPAKVLQVVDGDTIYMEADLGFYVNKRVEVRLEGVDTHEIHGVHHDSTEYQLGMDETHFVVNWVRNTEEGVDYEYPFILDSKEKINEGKYGRWIAEVASRRTGGVLNQTLLDEFDDVEYEG